MAEWPAIHQLQGGVRYNHKRMNLTCGQAMWRVATLTLDPPSNCQSINATQSY